MGRRGVYIEWEAERSELFTLFCLLEGQHDLTCVTTRNWNYAQQLEDNDYADSG